MFCHRTGWRSVCIQADGRGKANCVFFIHIIISDTCYSRSSKRQNDTPNRALLLYLSMNSSFLFFSSLLSTSPTHTHTQVTGGLFGVPLEKTHFRELLHLHVTPPVRHKETDEEVTTNFVEMCFPRLELK